MADVAKDAGERLLPLCATFRSAKGVLRLGEKTMKKSAKIAKRGQGRFSGRFAGSKGWIAVGTLAAYAVMGGTRQALAYEEKVGGAGSGTAGGAEASLPLKRFNIGAGPLYEAIAAYEKATGLTVKVVLPTGTLAGFKSQGVSGLYPEEEAMRLLLDWTGLN
jgi:catecholate siderophore receptor